MTTGIDHGDAVGMPKLAALASAAANICFASSSVRLVYVRGISPHLYGVELYRASIRRGSASGRYLGALDPDGLRVDKSVRTEV